MSNEHKDILIKEQLQSISPLEGGVVFGKEAAWDKLEQRLDKEKPRVFAFKSWAFAAAAVFLLSLFVAVLYMKAPLREEAWAFRAAQTDTPFGEPSNTMTFSGPGSLVKRNPRRNKPAQELPKNTDTQMTVATAPFAIDTPKVATVVEMTVKTNDPFKNMRVVHINDLNGDAPVRQGTTIWIANRPRHYFKADMPVVHINDLLQPNLDNDRYQTQGRGLLERFAQRSINVYGDYSSPFQQNASPSPFKLIFRGRGN